jgi:ATP-dependent Clp protease ATP-binding subunit ClpA
MMWDRLSPEGREVVRLAHVEARELGHPCLADEHVLLGLLRHASSEAAALLRAHGLDLAGARAELLRVGPTLGPRTDPAGALTGLGIEVEEIRRRLQASFGTEALAAAERRVRRRPRWRGGHPRPNALCHYLLAKRAFEFADRLAKQRGDAAVGPEHLLYGRRELATVGWTAGRPNPLRLVLEARGIDLAGLTAELRGST